MRRAAVWTTTVWALMAAVAEGYQSSYNYVPQGSSPTLYTPGFEPIMHLDQNTFADTVFVQDKSFVVEFYADWCGHCRAFVPYFREFANQVFGWNKVVTVAVMNCADSYNVDVCKANGISEFPTLKYFARTARRPSDAVHMDPQHSADGIRDALLRSISNEYAFNRYPDWPMFTPLQVDGRTTYGQLWQGIPESADYMAIVFEISDGVGARFQLDMWEKRGIVGTRRALSNSPLVQMLRIREFPSVALFRRDHQQAIYMSRVHNASFGEIEAAINADRASHHVMPVQNIQTSTFRPITTTLAPVVDCARFPDRCADMFYVSETDMLKSMHQALYDSVRDVHGGMVQGDNFTNLYNFVDLLANHFPVLSFSNELRRTVRKKRTSSTILKNSERARLVFTHMREWLEARKGYGHFPSSEWIRQFEMIERVYARPFPTNSSWQHCEGSSGRYRGYTCGLWTTFHAITVHTYIDTIK
ncbi:unnamed protein product, partial [Mesorhabditis spiculigera]